MKLSEWEANTIFGEPASADPETFLYHYTSVERAAGIALLGSISLSPLGPMNDPRESQLRQISTLRSTSNPGEIPTVTDEQRQEFEEALWDLRGKVRLACFTQDRIEGDHATRADGRGYAHSRMWAQYAAAHTGVCIVFDRQALSEAARSTFSKRIHEEAVTYVAGFDRALAEAETVNFDRPDPRAHHLLRVVPSLFVKNVDWQSEHEYRLIVDEWGDEPCLLPVQRAVRGVVIGAGFQPHNLPLIRAFADKFGISGHVAQIVVNAGVLQSWPARDRYGNYRVWTDKETRGYDTIFDRE